MEPSRPAQLSAPPGMPGELVVPAPPQVPRVVPANPVVRLLPVVMVVAMVGMMVLYFSSGSPAMRTPMFSLFPVMMLASAVGTLTYGARGTHRTAELNADRRQYLRRLDDVRHAAQSAAAAQQRSLHRRHPQPDALWALVGGPRMWERTRADPDFGHLRIGVADQPLVPGLAAPQLPSADDADPVTATAVRRLLRHWALVPNVPVTVPVFDHSVVTLTGTDAHGLARAMICGLVVLHSPDELRIAAVVAADRHDRWDWLKWLPHHHHPSRTGETGPTPLRYRSLADVEDDRTMGPHRWLVITDGCPGAHPGAPGTTVLAVGPGAGTTASDGLLLDTEDPDLTVDSLTPAAASACARRLAAFRAALPAGPPSAPSSGWLALMGLQSLGDVPDAHRCSPRTVSVSGPVLAPVPIGCSDDGAAVELDINEAARGGVGPHGLCVGATGSGKSEFLRTLALGMITAHPPELLNLILIDFKGGATFLGLDRAPHVCAVITNLAEEAQLVARMYDALSGEMTRRQELLRAAGNVANIADYAAARVGRPTLPALPALVIAVDEFSELLAQHPEFADLFVAIGRLGRSLGMYLLLSSQRVDEGRLRGLETHLSYRICLKTFSTGDSRAVLGVPDAYHLPATPGAALLKTVSDELVRFHTAYVSGPYRETDTAPSNALSGPRLFTATPIPPDPIPNPDGATVRTLLDTVVDRLAGRGTPAHRVWLEPLTGSPPLSRVLELDDAAPLSVPIGVVDCPFEQRRIPLVAALADSDGNVAVVGGPRSGKSTAVRTLVLALAATHDPRDVQVYCIDCGGGALSALTALPHVGTVAGRRDDELIARMVAVLETVIADRESRFRAAGIDSMAEYRRRRAAFREPDDPYGDVFLVIDGMAVIRHEFDALEPRIAALATQGLSYGVHVIVTASRWAELRPALKDQIGTRIELRLGDPADSEMDRRRARHLLDSAPGRGLTREGRELTIALPRLDEAATTTGLTESIGASGQALRIRYQQRSAPPIELLPDHVEHRAVLDKATDRQRAEIVLGIGETDLLPVAVDVTEQPHLVVLGDGQCGKTTVLRTLCQELLRTRGAASAQLVLVDFRRTLLGAVDTECLAGYVMSPGALQAELPVLIERLRARLPGAEVTQQQLRDRSWWSGPDVFLVIDDYDLVAEAAATTLAPLTELLSHATDIGLHVIVARRSGGAARALFDPVLARLRELSATALVMSAHPDEGPLWGLVRPTPLPPGRATLLVRGHPLQRMQASWTDPE
ncbi:type VII secretion protein EccCb [Mycolicibacterium thermoresistibile]